MNTPVSLISEDSAKGTPSEYSKPGFHARQLFVFGVILYFTFIGGSFYSDFNFSLRILNQLVVTALLGGWLVIKLGRGEPFPRTSLDVPIVIWLAAHFIAALFGLSPRFSLEKVWAPFTHALAFYLLVDLLRKGQTTVVARGLYMCACVVCLVGLTEFASWYLGLPLLPDFAQGWPAIGDLRHPFPPTLYRLNFTLNGSTPLSAYLALLIPPALGILLTTRNRDDRKAIATWLILAAIVEGLSFSRGGVLALLVSLPLTGVGWWLARQRSNPAPGIARGLWMVRRSTVAAPLAVLLILAMLVGPAWLQNTFNRAYSTQFRFMLWKVALTVSREHPFTGVGPHNFGRSMLRRNDPLLPRRQITTAHSIYLNTIAESGLIGLAAGSWLLLAVGRAWLTRWRNASGVSEQVQVAACGAALAGLAAQGLVDTFAPTPNVLPVLAVAAFTLTDRRETRQVHVAWRKWQGTRPVLRAPIRIALSTLVLYAIGLAWLSVGQFHFQRSVDLAGQGDLEEAVVSAERARWADPALTLYTFQAAYLYGKMTDQADAPVLAAALYQAGLADEPVDGRQTANLAAVLWQAGNRQIAVDTLVRAITVEPNSAWLVNLGHFYQQLGNLDDAIRAYARALALSPGLSDSQFWSADAERSAHWSDILSHAEEAVVREGGDLTSWRLQIALEQEDWTTVGEQASAILEYAPVDCYALSALARARFEMGRVGEAMNLAQRAIDAQRACGAAYVVRGLAKHGEGDLAAAEKDWRTAIFLNHRQAAYYLGRLHQAQGDDDGAARFYSMALLPLAVPTDVEVTLYDRQVAFDLLPPLFHIGMGLVEASPWLALGQLREAQGDLEAARQVYRVLLLEDPYLGVAQERLDALSNDQ